MRSPTPLCLALLAVACADPGTPGADTAGEEVPPDPPEEPALAHLRFVHLHPSLAPVEVRLDEELLFPDVQPLQATDHEGGHLPVHPATTDLRVYGEGEPIAELPALELEADAHLTVLLRADGDGKPLLQVVEDNVHNVMLGMHHVTVHHLAVERGPLVLWLGEDPVTDPLPPGGSSPMLMAGVGTTELGLGGPEDSAPFQVHPAQFDELAWSYLYILERDSGMELLHHRPGHHPEVLPLTDSLP